MAEPVEHVVMLEPPMTPPFDLFDPFGLPQLAPRYRGLAEPFAAAVAGLAADVNGRWCFNCAARVGYTEEEGLPMSRAWWPVQLLACGGEVTVVCLGCADPFGDGR